MRLSILVLMMSAACTLLACFPSPARAEVLVETESLYHHIIIEAHGSVRSMLFRRRGSDNNESTVDLSSPLRPQMNYTKLMFSGLLYCDQPSDILIIGLGGGTLSHLFAYYFPQASIVSVELDPVVFDVAKKHFGFKETEKSKVVVRDGRVYVKRALQKKSPRFDLIMLDAFRGGYVPFHLTTKEFMTECKQLLKPGGVVVSNLRTDFETYHYQRRTMDAVFATCQAFGGGNTVVCAFAEKTVVSPKELKKRAEALQTKHRFQFDLLAVVDALEGRPSYETKGEIFTDDYAPANILQRK